MVKKTHVPAIRTPAGRKHTTTSRKAVAAGTALVPVAAHAQAIVALSGVDAAEPVIQRDGAITLVVGQLYPMRGITIRASEVYYDADLRRDRPEGPALDEADKIAWRDPATGYECIMLRDRDAGFLSGYVGVPSGHPLFGFDHDALPDDLGVDVHGGLTYSRICDDGPSPDRRIIRESRRICHVVVGHAPLVHGSDYRVQEHAWWFGFSCDHLYDALTGRGSRHDRRFLAAETGPVYRDDAYVCTEVQNLAAQLRAIADGLPVPPRQGAPLPPRGLDPKEVN